METSPPAHTPYDGSSKPFTIGLKPLDPAEWIEVDGHLEAYLSEKDRLEAEHGSSIFVAESGTEDAQHEVLSLLIDYLPARFPDIYRRAGDTMHIGPSGRTIDLSGHGEPALKMAARLVQEDLVLMRRSEEGWRLAAASLSFPSSWSLAEKFGKPLRDIHRPVPQFGPGTRSDDLIERMFDRLQGQAVVRYNWSLQPDPDLYKPLSAFQRTDRADKALPRFPGLDPAAAAFIRVERQTLRKLPVSADVLFTIRIHLDPMAALRAHPDRARIAASFAAQLAALDRDQLDYKGLAADRDRLVTALEAIATA
ncbi:MAG: heme-dependent oxidative N-demethylase family protein [Rhizobiaceae bacterium]